ncbi:hypothetical protein U7230_07670 [Carboxydochorda subterranea]|uniref:Uncharacterized protein n=1 Tax=Carboxydichorda subterranea TaxID=3109565 RepID=A0ABZ1C1N9_9FIRM|nr:hypothetical protein [Limnochorda sp. L945t]WRP18859.1 hypothetical protein U7230_07670 [Limnochorda sp. L945t]
MRRPLVGPVVFPDPEHVQAHLVGQFDLLEQATQQLGRSWRP